MIHNNQPLLYVSYCETSATALCGTTGKCHDGHSPMRKWMTHWAFPWLKYPLETYSVGFLAETRLNSFSGLGSRALWE